MILNSSVFPLVDVLFADQKIHYPKESVICVKKITWTLVIGKPRTSFKKGWTCQTDIDTMQNDQE